MRRMLLVTALLGALAAGCADRPVAPAAEIDRAPHTIVVPTAAGTPPSVRPATRSPEALLATSTPTASPARTPEQACADLADRSRREQPMEQWLTLAAMAVSGEPQVRITHSGLQPGDYFAAVGVPGTDNWGVTLSPVGSAGADGKIDVPLTLPPINRCLVVTVGQRRPDGEWTTHARSLPFFPTGTPGSARTPRACDELPREIWGSFGSRLASISAAPYRVGAPITVSAELQPYPQATGLEVALSLVNGRLPPSNINDYVDTLVSEWNASGQVRYSFAPRANPALSGLCVSVVLTLQPAAGVAHPVAIARFTYP